MRTGSPDRDAARVTTPRVLVVEDDDQMRGLLCEVLAAHGYEPQEAPNDAQALLAIRERAMPSCWTRTSRA